jgi:hypothetical protein
MSSYSLLNVLVQTANRMGLQTRAVLQPVMVMKCKHDLPNPVLIIVRPVSQQHMKQALEETNIFGA